MSIRSLRNAQRGATERRAEDEINRRCRQGRDEQPDDDSAHSDHPELCKKHPRIRSELFEDKCDGKWNVRNAEEVAAGAVERDEKRELRWVGEVIYNLNHRLIQPQRPSCDRTQKRGRTEKRKHAQHKSQRYSQREFFRRHALLELR